MVPKPCGYPICRARQGSAQRVVTGDHHPNLFALVADRVIPKPAVGNKQVGWAKLWAPTSALEPRCFFIRTPMTWHTSNSFPKKVKPLATYPGIRILGAPYGL